MAVTSEERPRTSFSAVDIGDPLLEQQSNTFGHFVEEQQKSSTPFGQEHKSNASNAMKVTKSQAGEETLGDSEALRGWRDVSVLLPISLWIALSSAVILMNKWILSDLKFSYPIALTTIHLLFQTIASRLLHRYTRLVDGAKVLEETGKMNREVFLRNIVPIGVLFSISLVLSNWVYLRLSVSFIQMIKAVTPVVVLGVSVLFKVKTASKTLFGIVCIISLGVAIASYGEIDFDLLGFSVQLFAILIESCRLVLIQILLQGFGMDPIVSLYYFAPVCLATNTIALILIEGYTPLTKIMDVGPLTLLFNASCTFFLNLASVWLIGRASGLVLTLSGVVKDILLIAGSFIILGSTISGTQVFGYVIALTGLVLFKTQG